MQNQVREKFSDPAKKEQEKNNVAFFFVVDVQHKKKTKKKIKKGAMRLRAENARPSRKIKIKNKKTTALSKRAEQLRCQTGVEETAGGTPESAEKT